MRISDWSSDVCSSDLSAFLEDRRDGTLYAALNLGHFGVKLHRSEDFGATWTELPAPAFPVGMPADKEGEKAPSVSLIWTLAAGGPDQPGRLWAGTIPGALFRSEEHTSELQSLMRLSYAVFCLKKKNHSISQPTNF